MDYDIIFELAVTIFVFLILFAIGKYIYKKLKTTESRFLNPEEYLPEEEIQSLKQVYYLIIMLILFVFILYTIIIDVKDLTGIAILEIIILLYITLTLDYSSWKNKILFILLIPYGSISFLLFHNSYVGILDIVHIFAYVYLMKVYYEKFREYTETNSLGITIVLLFSLIFASFILTTIVEGVEPLNSLVMVSNAFTSNGYTILGTSSIGKINSLILVWGGYILSGVGTATLTAAILLRHTHKREEKLNKRLDELESLIKDNQK